jgi:hypothetical protein
MTSQRIMKSVLHNFLESYTSRNSDYDGFWVFGFMVETMQSTNVDLIGARSDYRAGLAPETFAVRLATTKFREQLSKSRLTLSGTREARLEIRKLRGDRSGFVNGMECLGWDVLFRVEAAMDSGETYRCEKSMFIAPHNSRVERRSTRGT